MAGLIKMNVFRKEIKVTKQNEKGKLVEQKFDTYFGKLTTECAKELECSEDAISVRLSNAVKDEIIASGINFPLELSLDENDYFLTEEEYETPEGITLEKTICVITHYQEIANASIEKKSLKDFFKKN